MKALSDPIYSFLDGTINIKKCTVKEVRKGPGYRVNSFSKLVERVAALSFNNPEYVLFFRGQARNYKDISGQTTLKPPLFRKPARRTTRPHDVIRERYDVLSRAEDLLSDLYDFDGSEKVRRFDILRWAILQHYQVCPTPLLDVTHSLRVASSFAHFKDEPKTTFLYVLAMPQISGSITASSEAGIQIVRLLSICPPQALRPHYQEGYLVGEYPTITLKGKREYLLKELDFGRRLLCKFRLGKPSTFWSHHFTNIQRGALFPDYDDKLKELTDEIKEQCN